MEKPVKEMDNNTLNLFKFDFLPWTHPSGIRSNIRMIIKRPRHIWYRIKYGVCPMDVWDFDSNLPIIMSNGLYMLLYDKSCGHSYPCDINTWEEWESKVNQIRTLCVDYVEAMWDMDDNADFIEEVLFDAIKKNYNNFWD